MALAIASPAVPRKGGTWYQEVLVYYYAAQDAFSFEPTEYTRGPWDVRFQHAGPPCALVARAMENALGEGRFSRLSFELLRPVPLAPVRVEVSERGGRRVQRVEAKLMDAGGKALIEARGTCLRVEEPALAGAEVHADVPDPPSVDSCEPFVFPFFQHEVGYHVSMELRYGEGTWPTANAGVWFRMKGVLVEGENVTPLQRVIAMADSANGITANLDLKHYTFMNPDLDVQLHRYPRGEWVFLRSRMFSHGTGVGGTSTTLFDTSGSLGVGTQSLLVTGR